MQDKNAKKQAKFALVWPLAAADAITQLTGYGIPPASLPPHRGRPTLRQPGESSPRRSWQLKGRIPADSSSRVVTRQQVDEVRV